MLKTKIILPDGTVLSSGAGERNAIVSATLTQKVNDQSELAPGSVCCAMLEATVIAPEGGLTLQAGTEVTCYKGDLCLGLFTLEKPTRASANTLKLTAYDRISWLDKDLSQWLADLTEWPYSLYDLAVMVCEACGLTLVNEDLPNGSYLVQRFSASGITGRQLMQWIGQAAGRFCRATPDGKAEFAWYAPAPVSIGPTECTDEAEGTAAVLKNVPSGAVLHPVTQITEETDKVTLLHMGKNLFDINTSTTGDSSSYYDTENGWLTNISASSNKEYVRVNIVELWQILKASGKSVTFSFDIKTAIDGTVKFYVLGRYAISLGQTFATTTQWQHKSVTVQPSAFYYKESDTNGDVCDLSWYGTYKTGVIPFVRNIQIEISDVETDYEPYQGQSLAAQLPEAVSQGSYDWSKGILTLEGQEPVRLEPVHIPALEGYNFLFSGQGETAVSYRQLGYYQNSLKYEDYSVAPIEKVQLRQNEEDVGTVYPDVTGQANAYIITGNPMLSANDAEELKPVAQLLYEHLKDISYTPCKVTVPADLCIRAGNTVQITDRNGKTVTAYIMTRTQSGQRDTLECTGSARRDSTTAVNNQSFGALNGRLLNLRTDVDGLKAENADMAGKAASMALTVEGIKAEVSAQEKTNQAVQKKLTAMEQTADSIRLSVQSIQDDGASKVTTSTGFTFNDTGLHISKSGSNLESSVTERGMYVTRNTDGTVMLQADAEGVIATDVSVRNYLKVGNHARFEDYADGRTACFYAGG